jgi:hypothetical protein
VNLVVAGAGGRSIASKVLVGDFCDKPLTKGDRHGGLVTRPTRLRPAGLFLRSYRRSTFRITLKLFRRFSHSTCALRNHMLYRMFLSLLNLTIAAV